MMACISDAAFVIDVLRGQADAPAAQPIVLREGLAISVITSMELWEGVIGNRDSQRAGKVLRQFFQPVTILPFSRTAARRTAALRAERRRQRRPLEQRATDLLVAGTGLTYNLALVTSDADLADIPDLKLLNPRAMRL